MAERIEQTALFLGYITLFLVVGLAALIFATALRWVGKLHNRWRYETLRRKTAELEWEQIRTSWIQENRRYEDRNITDRHDTLDLSDIQEQFYNYEEELDYEGR